MKTNRAKAAAAYAFICSICLVLSLGIANSTNASRLGSAPLTSETIQIQSFHSHSRISLRLDEGVDTQWHYTKTGFDLLLKGIGFADLGAPLGEEELWQRQFRDIPDPRVGNLTFKEVAGGILITGKWKYPQGAEALAHPEMEGFEYRDQASARYTLDFWWKRGITVAEAKKQNVGGRSPASIKAVESRAKAQTAARKLRAEKLAEFDDVNRFCREPISSTSDIEIPFYPAKEKIDLAKWFSANTPDSKFHYLMPQASDEAKDASYVRLALNLYQQGKPALALKTLDFFDAEVPESAYRAEMRFLRANAMIKLGLVDEGQALLSKITAEHKDSPVALPAAMYIAYKRVEAGSHLAAVEQFMWLIKNHGEHRLAWVFHLGAAESLAALKQTDRAVKEYQWIAEHAQDRRDQAMAAARVGDTYLDRFQYESALAAYYSALTNFPKEIGSIPGFQINRSETLYQLGQYDRAKEEFTKFLEFYPAHPFGWRATYRLALITGREAPRNTAAQSREWFNETVNHYPFSPGAVLARMQLMTCRTSNGEAGTEGKLSEKATDKFFAEDAKRIYTPTGGAADIMLKDYKDFEALNRVRIYAAISAERGIDASFDVMNDSSRVRIKPMTAQVLVTLFRRRLQEYVDRGDKFGALKFFEENQARVERWLTEDPADPSFLLALSQGASDLGLGQTAQQLSSLYGKVMARKTGRAVAAAPAGTNLDQQLVQSERDFTEAKALWVAWVRESTTVAPESPANSTTKSTAKLGVKAENKGESKSEADPNLARVKALLKTMADESPHALEREIILGLLAEKEGNFDDAVLHASKAQLLAGGQLNGADRLQADFRISAWLSGLHLKLGHLIQAIALSKNLENQISLLSKTPSSDKSAPNSGQQTLFTLLGMPSAPVLGQVVIARAEALESLGRWGEAAAVYDRVISEAADSSASAEAKNGANRFGSQALYGKARALLKSGKRDDRALALDTLQKLIDRKPASGATSGNDFWKNLASETLANEKLSNEKLNHDAPGRANP